MLYCCIVVLNCCGIVAVLLLLYCYCIVVVNGGLSQWSVWGVCTVKCGGGEHTRSRTCTEPAPSHGGASCTGFLHESQACNIQACSTPAAAASPPAASAAAPAAV